MSLKELTVAFRMAALTVSMATCVFEVYGVNLVPDMAAHEFAGLGHTLTTLQAKLDEKMGALSIPPAGAATAASWRVIDQAEATADKAATTSRLAAEAWQLVGDDGRSLSKQQKRLLHTVLAWYHCSHPEKFAGMADAGDGDDAGSLAEFCRTLLEGELQKLAAAGGNQPDPVADILDIFCGLATKLARLAATAANLPDISRDQIPAFGVTVQAILERLKPFWGRPADD